MDWLGEVEEDVVPMAGCQCPEEVLSSVGPLQAVLLVMLQAAAQLCSWVTVGLEQRLLAKVLILHTHTHTQNV